MATYAPTSEGLSIEVLKLGSDAPPRAIRPANFVFSLSPDSKNQLAVGFVGIELRDAQTGGRLASFDAGGAMMAQSVAFDPSGKRVAVALAGPKPTDARSPSSKCRR